MMVKLVKSARLKAQPTLAKVCVYPGVLVSNDDNDILIQFKGSESDSIRVESANRFLIGDLYAVETIKFADTSMAMKDVVGWG